MASFNFPGLLDPLQATRPTSPTLAGTPGDLQSSGTLVGSLDDLPEHASLGADPAAELSRIAHGYGLKLSSAGRTPVHNKEVGGKPDSYHLKKVGSAGSAGYDWEGSPENMRAFTEHLRDVYGTSLRELYHDPVGGWEGGKSVGPIGKHGNHVHVAVYPQMEGTLDDLPEDETAATTPAPTQAAPTAPTPQGQQPAVEEPPAVAMRSVPGEPPLSQPSEFVPNPLWQQAPAEPQVLGRPLSEAEKAGPEGFKSQVYKADLGDYVSFDQNGKATLKPGVSEQQFLEGLYGTATSAAGFTPEAANKFLQEQGHTPIARFFQGADPRATTLGINTILSEVKPGPTGRAAFDFVVPPAIQGLYKPYTASTEAEKKENLERDLAAERATLVDKAAREGLPIARMIAAPIVGLAEQVLPESVGRNISQFGEELMKGASLGHIDPTLAGQGEGEKYTTPGAHAGGLVGGLVPLIAAGAVGGPMATALMGAGMPLLQRIPGEQGYQGEERLKGALTSEINLVLMEAAGGFGGAGAGLLGAIRKGITQGVGFAATGPLLHNRAPNMEEDFRPFMEGLLLSTAHSILAELGRSPESITLADIHQARLLLQAAPDEVIAEYNRGRAASQQQVGPFAVSPEGEAQQVPGLVPTGRPNVDVVGNIPEAQIPPEGRVQEPARQQEAIPGIQPIAPVPEPRGGRVTQMPQPTGFEVNPELGEALPPEGPQRVPRPTIQRPEEFEPGTAPHTEFIPSPEPKPSTPTPPPEIGRTIWHRDTGLPLTVTGEEGNAWIVHNPRTNREYPISKALTEEQTGTVYLKGTGEPLAVRSIQDGQLEVWREKGGEPEMVDPAWVSQEKPEWRRDITKPYSTEANARAAAERFEESHPGTVTDIQESPTGKGWHWFWKEGQRPETEVPPTIEEIKQAQVDRQAIERKLVRGFLDNPSTEEGRAKAYQDAGYRNVDGFWVHPGVDPEYIRGLSDATKEVMRANGISFIRYEPQEGVAGRVVLQRSSSASGNVDTRGMAVRVDPEMTELYTDRDHVVLHEIGHHAWSELTPEQRNELASIELKSDYGKRLKAGLVEVHPVGPESAAEEEFAERFAEAGGDLQKVLTEAGLGSTAERTGEIVAEEPARVTGIEGIVKRAREGERRAATEGAVDALTGLQNQGQWKGAQARVDSDPNTHVARLDVNDLKRVNDTYGHEAGDEYISEVGRIIREEATRAGVNARSQFRTGGDEFTLAGDPEAIARAAQAIKDRIAREVMLPDGRNGSVATGVAPTEAAADEAMYADKQGMKAQRRPEDFHALGDAQRGAAETAMTRAQMAMGGGVLNPVIEHVGDLIHRMSERATFETAGFEFVRDKVKKVLGWLKNEYGFRNEYEDNIRNNARNYGVTPDALRTRVEDALGRYTYEHQQLPAFNEAQRLAQDAAVAIGERRFEDAIAPLEELAKHLDNREEWVRFAHEGLEAPTGVTSRTQEGAREMVPESAGGAVENVGLVHDEEGSGRIGGFRAGDMIRHPEGPDFIGLEGRPIGHKQSLMVIDASGPKLQVQAQDGSVVELSRDQAELTQPYLGMVGHAEEEAAAQARQTLSGAGKTIEELEEDRANAEREIAIYGEPSSLTSTTNAIRNAYSSRETDGIVFDRHGNPLTVIGTSPPEGLRVRNAAGKEFSVHRNSVDEFSTEDIPNMSRDMALRGLDANAQFEAFKALGLEFKDPLQMAGTIRGVDAATGARPSAIVKYKEKGQVQDYTVVGRFPTGEKLMVLTPDGETRIIKSPHAETGNQRIVAKISKAALKRVPKIDWPEVGLLSDVFPTITDIQRVNKNATKVEHLSEAELERHFPQVYKNLKDAEGYLGDKAGREVINQATEEDILPEDVDMPEMVRKARDRNRQKLVGNRLSANPVETFLDTAIVTGWNVYQGLKQAARKFDDWSEEMIKRLDETVRPQLENVWDAITKPAPFWFSPLERTIQMKMTGRMPAAQLRALLDKAGLSRDELEWTTLNEFLKSRANSERPEDRMITRAEALEILAADNIQIRENWRGLAPDVKWKQVSREGSEIGEQSPADAYTERVGQLERRRDDARRTLAEYLNAAREEFPIDWQTKTETLQNGRSYPITVGSQAGYLYPGDFTIRPVLAATEPDGMVEMTYPTGNTRYFDTAEEAQSDARRWLNETHNARVVAPREAVSAASSRLVAMPEADRPQELLDLHEATKRAEGDFDKLVNYGDDQIHMVSGKEGTKYIVPAKALNPTVDSAGLDFQRGAALKDFRESLPLGEGWDWAHEASDDGLRSWMRDLPRAAPEREELSPILFNRALRLDSEWRDAESERVNLPTERYYIMDTPPVDVLPPELEVTGPKETEAQLRAMGLPGPYYEGSGWSSRNWKYNRDTDAIKDTLFDGRPYYELTEEERDLVDKVEVKLDLLKRMLNNGGRWFSVRENNEIIDSLDSESRRGAVRQVLNRVNRGRSVEEYGSLGEATQDAERRATGAQPVVYTNYQTPRGGGDVAKNYRELLMILPQGMREPYAVQEENGKYFVTRKLSPQEMHLRDNIKTQRLTREFQDTEGETAEAQAWRYANELNAAYAVVDEYKSSHWPHVNDVNTFLHARLNDREIPIESLKGQYPKLYEHLKAQGKETAKVLHGEEFQSDWMQTGKKQGFIRQWKKAETDKFTIESPKAEIEQSLLKAKNLFERARLQWIEEGPALKERLENIQEAHWLNHPEFTIRAKDDSLLYRGNSQQDAFSATNGGSDFGDAGAYRDWSEYVPYPPEWHEINAKYNELFQEKDKLRKEVDQLEIARNHVRDEYIVKDADGAIVYKPETHTSIEEALERVRRAALNGMLGSAGSKVPPAPFGKSWPELGFKRMLRFAAENGYDMMSWTTAEDQFRRWQSEKIQWTYRPAKISMEPLFARLGFAKDLPEHLETLGQERYDDDKGEYILLKASAQDYEHASRYFNTIRGDWEVRGYKPVTIDGYKYPGYYRLAEKGRSLPTGWIIRKFNPEDPSSYWAVFMDEAHSNSMDTVAYESTRQEAIRAAMDKYQMNSVWPKMPYAETRADAEMHAVGALAEKAKILLENRSFSSDEDAAAAIAKSGLNPDMFKVGKGDDAWYVYGETGTSADLGISPIDIVNPSGSLKEGGQYIGTRDQLRPIVENALQRDRHVYSEENFKDKIDRKTDQIWKEMQKQGTGQAMPRKEGMEGFLGGIIGGHAKTLGKKFGSELGTIDAPLKKDITPADLGESAYLVEQHPQGKYIVKKGNTDYASAIPGSYDTEAEAQQVVDFLDKSKFYRTYPAMAISPEMRDSLVRIGQPISGQAESSMMAPPSVIEAKVRHDAERVARLQAEAAARKNNPSQAELQQAVTPKITETPEFKEKMAGTKAVDKKGKPVRIYRGGYTDNPLQSAKPGGPIVFFDAQADATVFAGLEKQLQPGGPEATGEPRLAPAYLAMKNPIEYNAKGQIFESVWDTANNLLEEGKTEGKDGLIIRNVRSSAESKKPGTSYIALDPAQVIPAEASSGRISLADLTPDQLAKFPEAAEQVEAVRQSLGEQIGTEAIRHATAEVLPKDITQTPEFKRRIEGTAILDQTGKPMRVYHGTPQTYEEYRKEASGIWFSDDPTEASVFAYSRGIGQSFLPEPLEDFYHGYESPVGSKAREGANVRPAYLNIKNPYVIDAQGEEFIEWRSTHNINREIQRAKVGGHDGIILKNIKNYDTSPESTSYVAFEPEQVISAYNPAETTVEKSRQWLREHFNGGTLGGGQQLIPALYHTAVVSGWEVYKGAKDLAEWTKQMVDRLGERVKPWLDEVWAKMHDEAPRWYSPVENTLKLKMPARASVDQVKGILRGGGFIVKGENGTESPNDEMHWTGLYDFLQRKGSAKEPVTKQEVLDYLQKNQVQLIEREFSDIEEKALMKTLEEQLLQEPDSEWERETLREQIAATRTRLNEIKNQRPRLTTRFDQHVTEGGTNQREFTLALPVKKEKVVAELKNYGTEQTPIWTVVDQQGRSLGQYGPMKEEAERHVKIVNAGQHEREIGDTRQYELMPGYRLMRIKDLPALPHDLTTNEEYADNLGVHVDTWVIVEPNGTPLDFPMRGSLTEQQALKEFVEDAEAADAGENAAEYVRLKSGSQGVYTVPQAHAYDIPEADINRIAIIRTNDRSRLSYTPGQINNIGRRLMEAVGARKESSLASGAPDVGVRKGAITPLEAAQYSHAKGFRNDTTGAISKILHVDEYQDDLQNEIQAAKKSLNEIRQRPPNSARPAEILLAEERIKKLESLLPLRTVTTS